MEQQENVKINLERIFDKRFNTTIYTAIIERDSEKDNYDMFMDEEIIISRKKVFLDTWTLFFKELSPHLQYLKRPQRLDLIHLIFGNVIQAQRSLLYSWPTFFDIAIKNIERDLKNHIEYLKNKNKYEIH